MTAGNPCCIGLAGPWDPNATNQIPDAGGPGTYFAALAQFACITRDAGQDIILGKVTFQCVAAGDAAISVQTIPGFDTLQGCGGTNYDTADPANVTITQIGGAVCGNGVEEGTEQCDDGNTANGDCCSATCTFESAGSPCPDNELCNGDETCDGAGACQIGIPDDDGTPCWDGDICNGAETCHAGVCVAGTPLYCDDTNICTDDSCDPITGCQYVNNTAICDDGLFCTATDTCQAGICIGSSNPCPPEAVCNESNDSCEFSDIDNDGIYDPQDNCLNHPNGPQLGTCVRIVGGLFKGRGVTCVENEDCLSYELCDLNQLDVDATGIGDACECHGNFNKDLDVDGTDAFIFKADFGRSILTNPCPNNL